MFNHKINHNIRPFVGKGTLLKLWGTASALSTSDIDGWPMVRELFILASEILDEFTDRTEEC